MNIRGTHEAR